MTSKQGKISISAMIIGLAVVVFLFWLAYTILVTVFPAIKYILIIVGVLCIAGIVYVVYKDFVDPDFRQKTFKVLKTGAKDLSNVGKKTMKKI